MLTQQLFRSAELYYRRFHVKMAKVKRCCAAANQKPFAPASKTSALNAQRSASQKPTRLFFLSGPQISFITGKVELGDDGRTRLSQYHLYLAELQVTHLETSIRRKFRTKMAPLPVDKLGETRTNERDTDCLFFLVLTFRLSTRKIARKMENSNNGGQEEPQSDTEIKVRVPKRVLHFSDGVIEEYSDDETDSDNTPKNDEQKTVVDPKTLSWGPWMAYKAWSAGSTALSVCDYVGESLASFFGITTPKYYFELEEYKRREEQRAAKEEQSKGWSRPANGADNIQMGGIETNQPSPANV